MLRCLVLVQPEVLRKLTKLDFLYEFYTSIYIIKLRTVIEL